MGSEKLVKRSLAVNGNSPKFSISLKMQRTNTTRATVPFRFSVGAATAHRQREMHTIRLRQIIFTEAGKILLMNFIRLLKFLLTDNIIW